jgi:4-methyl-5(b-hydroxyethyl)-thiazole monophosphate biosynthesis
MLPAAQLIGECAEEEYDLIALPGGMPGAERLRDSAVLMGMLQQQREGDKNFAAICATPAVALEPNGVSTCTVHVSMCQSRQWSS